MTEIYLWIETQPLLWVFTGATLLFLGVNLVTSWRPIAKRINELGKGLGWGRASAPIILVGALTWLVIFLTLLFGLYKLVLELIWYPIPVENTALWNWRFALAQIAALTTILGAVIALPLTLNRLVLSRRQTETAEQGHITDRINKAVEGLGADKTVKRQRRKQSGELAYVAAENGEPDYSQPIMEEVTQPNLEVRIGAIFALERISQDSERDHIQIMEILCAYIRENAQTVVEPLPEGDPTPQEWREWVKHDLKPPRQDLAVALDVIRRRTPARKKREQEHGFKVSLQHTVMRKVGPLKCDFESADLSDSEWQGSDLSSVNFQEAILINAKLQIANLDHANLRGAKLAGTKMQATYLRHANLQQAVLYKSNLEGAYVSNAHLKNTTLTDVEMRGAFLERVDLQDAFLMNVNFHDSYLKGAELVGARLFSAKFNKHTNLIAANFNNAAVNTVDFSNVPQIAEHLPGMFGDGTVTLPGGHGPSHPDWPSHWSQHELSIAQFDEEWRKWQSDPDNYTPPEAPAKDG